jgi:hypothetical protein
LSKAQQTFWHIFADASRPYTGQMEKKLCHKMAQIQAGQENAPNPAVLIN